jgi:hypothetical protein
MTKHTFTFTDEELQCLRVCLQNAPCPYDIGQKKLVSNLEDKIGLPIKPKVEPLSLPKYDLTKYGITD